MEPFIGEICLFAFNFVPSGWLKCEGQLLSIQQYQALFALLGTTYGGNGTTNFALPNLQGRVVLGPNNAVEAFKFGRTGGAATVTLTEQQMPAHLHAVGLANVSATLKGLNDDGDTKSPGASCLAKSTSDNYSSEAPNVAMHGGSVSLSGSPTCAPAGGSSAHENMPPYLVLNYCIAVQGIFPPRD